MSNPEEKAHQNNDKTCDNPDNECLICLDEINNLSTTDVCNHRFCFDCIRQWSLTSETCPFCKREFTQIFHDFKEDGTHSSFELDDCVTLNVNNIADFVNYLTSQMFPYATIVSSTEVEDMEEMAAEGTEDGYEFEVDGGGDEPRYTSVLTIRIRDEDGQS